MESEDDETLEFDIEVVESSSSISLASNSIDENNQSNQNYTESLNTTVSTNPQTNETSHHEELLAHPERAQCGNDKIDSDLNRIETNENGSPLEGANITESVVSDEQRYAELIKEIGEFKVVEPPPTVQPGTTSQPEPPQSSDEDVLTSEKQTDSTGSGDQQVDEQIEVGPPDEEGDDSCGPVVDKSEGNGEEAGKPLEIAPTIELDKVGLDFGEVEEEDASRFSQAVETAPSIEQPSAENMIPLDSELKISSQVETEQSKENHCSERQGALDEQLVAGLAANVETEQVETAPLVDNNDLTEIQIAISPMLPSEMDVDREGLPEPEIEGTASELENPKQVEPQEEPKEEPQSPSVCIAQPVLVSSPSPSAEPQLNDEHQQPASAEVTVEPDDRKVSLEVADQAQVIELDLSEVEPELELDIGAVVDQVELMEQVEVGVEPATLPTPADPEQLEPASMKLMNESTGEQEVLLKLNDRHAPEETETDVIEAKKVDIIIEASENEETVGAIKLDIDQRRDSGSIFGGEDLEWEFDNEPVFERRNIEVKRNCNPRLEYQLGEELGRGRFGTVYRCVEQASGRKLAAKFVHMRRREDREDVEREVKIMSLLQHKRLLQLYDAMDDGKSEMCLITELVEGGELFERIVDDDFELTEKKAAIFMRQICEGADYMHSQNIVHLDMKPENILCVSKSGNRIKLIDFGLARQLNDKEPLRVMFGTPDFAAPEVLAYDTVSLATDMWSVGVICYVLLSGLSPFMGDNDMETMANVTRATYDFDDQVFEPISDLAKDFISKLLVSDQSKRLKPRECLKHPWLQRGGVQLEASVLGRRESIQLAALQEAAPADQAALISLAAAAGAQPILVSLDKRNLKKYVVRRKWHKTVHAIMALGRMGANLKHRLAN